MKQHLHRYTVKELKKEISKQNIKGYSKMKKAEIIDLMLKNKSKFSYLMQQEKYETESAKRYRLAKGRKKPSPEPIKRPKTGKEALMSRPMRKTRPKSKAKQEPPKTGKEALMSRPMRKTRAKSKAKKEKKPKKSEFEKNMAKMGYNVTFIKRKIEKPKGDMTFEDFKKYFDNRYDKNFSEEKLLKLHSEDRFLKNKRTFNSYFKDIIEASKAYSYATNSKSFLQKIVEKDAMKRARKTNPEYFKQLDEENARKKEMEKFSNRGLKKLREFFDKKGFKYKMGERSVKKLKNFYINNYPIDRQ